MGEEMLAWIVQLLIAPMVVVTALAAGWRLIQEMRE